MVTEAVIEEYIERINDTLCVSGGDGIHARFSYEKAENSFILKSGTDVLFISEDIELFFAYVSFWWMWFKRKLLKIS